MHRKKSKLAAVALVAAVGLGIPALAKTTHGSKAKAMASLSARDLEAQRERGLNVYRSIRRTPTFGAPHNPVLIGGGAGYNANFYVY